MYKCVNTKIIGENLVLQYSAANIAPDLSFSVLLYELHLQSIHLIYTSATLVNANYIGKSVIIKF